MDVTDVVVIGAGQAGLAMSRCLTTRGLGHVVLEKGRVGQRWRHERWDSFTLLSPNWQTRLPGRRYTGHDPDGFMTGREVADMLAGYAAETGADVREGVTVAAIEPGTGGWWRVRTARADGDAGDVHARAVVVATGDLDRPVVPALAASLPAHVAQVHTRDYRRPGQLPPGGVLVVGAGPSGQQIAAELAGAGRVVHVAAGRHKNLPRRYRGHDTYGWMDRMGTMSRTRASLPDPAATRTPNAVLTGGVRDLDLHRLVAEGVTPHGRLVGVRDGVATFDGSLPEIVADAEANAVRFRAQVDRFVARHGLDCPAEEPRPARDAPWAQDAPATLDLAGVGSVVWATGFRRDFSWVGADVLDAAGEPVHDRGVTAAPGLCFLGLKWQHRRSSSFLDGVGADAEYLADHLACELAASRALVAA